MEQGFKSIHEYFWIGDKITMGKETVLVEESVVFGGKDYFLTELKVKNTKGDTLVFPFDMFSREIINHTADQTSILRVAEKLIKRRLMESDKSSIFVFKDEDISYKFELLSNVISGFSKCESSPRIYINEQVYLLSNYAVVSSGKGEGILAYLTKDGNNLTLLNIALYSEVIFEVSYRKETLKYMGNIVRIEPLKTGYLLYIHPYSMEIMQSTQIGAISCENGIHPFKLMDFLINSADSDVKGIEYPGKDTQPISEYLVAGVLRNLDINIENLVIGPVRFNETINMSQQFDMELEKIPDKKTVVWVNVKEKTFYEAYKKGRELIYAARDLLEFALKSDTYMDWYGIEKVGIFTWDIRSHTPELELSTLFYIENCIMGENITVIDKNVLTPAEISINSNVEELFEKEWIDDFFDSIQQNKQEILRLQYAMKWIIQAWHAENPYDRLIYCSMGLEFIVNGEKGSNIFNEYAQYEGRVPFTKREKKALIESIVNKVEIEEIDGLSKETVKKLNESIQNIIGASLSQPSFNTKLDSLIRRLGIPVSSDEKELLFSARKARNDLIHGIEMQAISTLDAKKLCGVTSRILVCKIIDKTEE
ncbi:MAG: hypothetical protein E7222_09980 [Clostridiales bacterium]|nr:hypothetical protein [Clostridiales bacterium]